MRKNARIAGSDNPDPYYRTFSYPKWNRYVRVTDVYQLFKRLPEFKDWDRDQHVSAAVEYAKIALTLDAMHRQTTDLAFQFFGDGNGVLVSGIVRDHFPDPVKEALRTFAHTASEYRDRSVAHWQYGRKTLATWRRMLQEIS